MKASIRLDAYAILARAVEEGITCGLNRAYKHTDAPTREQLEQQIEVAVMRELCDVLDFES